MEHAAHKMPGCGFGEAAACFWPGLGIVFVFHAIVFDIGEVKHNSKFLHRVTFYFTLHRVFLFAYFQTRSTACQALLFRLLERIKPEGRQGGRKKKISISSPLTEVAGVQVRSVFRHEAGGVTPVRDTRQK